MPRKAWLLQLSRKVHLYFGLLISPALLFFAFTGAVQTLGYHEASSNYKPPALLASLGQIHKKQTYLLPARREPGAGGQGSRPDGGSAVPSPPAVSASPSSPEGAATRHHRNGEPEHASPSVLQGQTAGPAAQASPAAASPSSHSDAPGGSQVRPAGQGSPTLQSKQKQHLPLKIFFLIVSLGLFVSTFTGIYMAYKYNRNKILVTLILVAGVVIPIVLLRF